MTYVALGSLVLSLGVVFGCAQLVRNLVRQQARERALLINQILHLSGRPWEPPPVEESVRVLEQAEDRYVSSPSDLLEDF